MYCGHFGERNRLGDRLECAVGPHQKSLEPYSFSPKNYYVEDLAGKKVEGILSRDAYTITFVAKQPFTEKKKYRLRIDLSSLNKGQKTKLRLSWDKKISGLGTFCFEGMETIPSEGSYSNGAERGNCGPQKN